MNPCKNPLFLKKIRPVVDKDTTMTRQCTLYIHAQLLSVPCPGQGRICPYHQTLTRTPWLAQEKRSTSYCDKKSYFSLFFNLSIFETFLLYFLTFSTFFYFFFSTFFQLFLQQFSTFFFSKFQTFFTFFTFFTLFLFSFSLFSTLLPSFASFYPLYPFYPLFTFFCLRKKTFHPFTCLLFYLF